MRGRSGRATIGRCLWMMRAGASAHCDAASAGIAKRSAGEHGSSWLLDTGETRTRARAQARDGELVAWAAGIAIAYLTLLAPAASVQGGPPRALAPSGLVFLLLHRTRKLTAPPSFPRPIP